MLPRYKRIFVRAFVFCLISWHSCGNRASDLSPRAIMLNFDACTFSLVFVILCFYFLNFNYNFLFCSCISVCFNRRSVVSVYLYCIIIGRCYYRCVCHCFILSIFVLINYLSVCVLCPLHSPCPSDTHHHLCNPWLKC